MKTSHQRIRSGVAIRNMRLKRDKQARFAGAGKDLFVIIKEGKIQKNSLK